MRGLPIGSIIPWSGANDTIPTGWVACDGSVIQSTRYPLLYKLIGTVYGGTAGSTFRLPELNEGKAVMDIYPGHYTSLSSFNPSKASTTTKSTDPYWNAVGEDENTDNSFSGTSTIDVVASFINSSSPPNLVATVSGISFNKGNWTQTYGLHPRKLSDRHQKFHNHTTSREGPSDGNSFTDGGKNCSTDSNGRNSSCDFFSKGSVTSNTLGTRRVPSSGSTSNANVPGGSSANLSGMDNDGNGRTGGDMWSGPGGGNGTYNFASSLSAEARTWAEISGHSHSTPTGTFKCNVNATSNYTFYDVSSSGVSIVQAPPDAAVININTLTPSLDMIFIIKAF